MMPLSPSVTKVSHPLATIWLARESWDKASYFYGGTRLVEHHASDVDVSDALVRLMRDESGIKNRLINWALDHGAVDGLEDRLPPGFTESRVGGARCLIRPHSQQIASMLSDPLNPENKAAATAVLGRIGNTLNEREPRIKLTPDFGRYAGLADMLHQYTPNVLGIACDKGGCGGKSSYSTTGVLAAVAQVSSTWGKKRPVTLIGSAGAMGSGVVEHFIARKEADLAVCDLSYDAQDGSRPPRGVKHLKARDGQFTKACLKRGGAIVATTVGDEIENSPWQEIPRGTALFLAHNLALPEGEKGIRLAQSLHENGVLAIPGQVLTLGGALTGRVEWYWRQLPSKPAFDKQLAHAVVGRVVAHVVKEILAIAGSSDITLYEAMICLADEAHVEAAR